MLRYQATHGVQSFERLDVRELKIEVQGPAVTQFTVPQYLIHKSQASRLAARRVAIYTRRPVASVFLLLVYIVLLGPACRICVAPSLVLPFAFLLSRFVLEKPRIRGSDHRNNLRACPRPHQVAHTTIQLHPGCLRYNQNNLTRHSAYSYLFALILLCPGLAFLPCSLRAQVTRPHHPCAFGLLANQHQRSCGPTTQLVPLLNSSSQCRSHPTTPMRSLPSIAKY